jgi:cellulose synthase/poly-beta-1,6-N-acetylglucosamine synthase-like glycosyltransferase
MKLLFWSSLSLIFITYVAYPVWLYFRARFRPRPVRQASIFPSITILLAVHNEQKYLPAKLQNLAALDYPADLVDVIVVSDGSTDETNKILAAWKNANRRPMILMDHRGKATALNHGVAEAKGEITVFTDARQTIALGGLKYLVENFADPTVGCVSGELIISQDGNSVLSEGIGLYWGLEKKIRYWEGLAGSMVGATGAFYAARRNLLLPLPQETILDDVHIPFQVVQQGQRVVFEPRARAWDYFKPGPKLEFRRKVRTLVGNYQLLQLAPWLLTRSNPLLIQFVCHKLLRLFVPFALMGVLISTVWLRHGVYELVLGLQSVLYALAALTIFRKKTGFLFRLSNISLAFLVLNTAAMVAFFYIITGRKEVWARQPI